ncbi:MAG: hypothetical protein LBB66_07015 [Desulfovibrio sp.]|jgi:hypothetical protein|nr:hypothetical protein [Desulfovibrio sp.]
MGLLRFCLALAALWGVIQVLAPIPVEHFAPMRDYAQVVLDTGIAPGALYYTDVAQSNDAEMSNRDSIRYFARRGVGPAVFVFLAGYFMVLLCLLIRRRRK